MHCLSNTKKYIYVWTFYKSYELWVCLFSQNLHLYRRCVPKYMCVVIKDSWMYDACYNNYFNLVSIGLFVSLWFYVSLDNFFTHTETWPYSWRDVLTIQYIKNFRQDQFSATNLKINVLLNLLQILYLCVNECSLAVCLKTYLLKN